MTEYLVNSSGAPVKRRNVFFVLFREISCKFVDRVLTLRSHTIHETTLN